MRNRRVLTALVAGLLLWSSLPAQAAQPADGIPDSASLVVRFKAPQTTLDKLGEYIDAVQPGAGAAVQSSLPALGQSMGNAEFDGVDTKQDLWVVIFAQPEDPPTVVFVVTAKDVDDVKDALPANFEVHTSGKLVAYSEDGDSLQEVAKGLDGKGDSLLASIDAASRKLFDGSDVAMLVNVAQLAEDFSDQLDQAEPQLNQLIDQVVASLPDAQSQQLAPVFSMYRTMGVSVIQGVRDTESFLVGLSFSKSVIRVEKRIQVSEGSPSAKALAAHVPGDLGLVGKLPANRAVYVGMKFDISSMVDWSMKLSQSMFPALAENEDVEKAIEEMRKLKYQELAMYFDVGTQAPALQAGSITLVNSPAKLREISHTLTKSMGELETPAFKQKTTLYPKDEKIGTLDVDRITVQQEFPEELDPSGMQKKVQDLLFGENGMEQRIAYQDKAQRVLQSLGGKAELEVLVKSVESTGSENAPLAKSRQLHPAKANIVAFADLARLAQRGLQLAAQQPDSLPINVAALEGLELETSFLGFSLVCEPQSVQTKFEVPVEQSQNIARLIMALTGR